MLYHMKFLSGKFTEKTSYNMFLPEHLREYAKTSNIIKRERKIDHVAMF